MATATATKTNTMPRWTTEESQDLLDRINKAHATGASQKSVFEEIASERGVQSSAVQQKFYSIQRREAGHKRVRSTGAKPAFSLRSVHLGVLSNDDLLKLRDMLIEEGQKRADTSVIEASEKERIAQIKAEAKQAKDRAKKMATLF